MIDECLEHLERQTANIPAEILVADITGEQTVQRIRQRFPKTIVLPFAEKRSIPELRAAALQQSKGDIVAVIEDHCNVTPDWFERIVKAHGENPNCVAVGGAVENGSRERLVDWAVFFTEYNAFMPPLPRGVTNGITGNNVSYKRAAFEGWPDAAEMLSGGFWETTLHPRLLERGEKFFLEPDILVSHKKHFPFAYFSSQRFVYSRYYAGLLAQKMSLPGRAARGVASFALPPLLLYRIVRGVTAKGGRTRELIQTIPLLAVFTAIWGMGEVVGCFFGPGDSLKDIE